MVNRTRKGPDASLAARVLERLRYAVMDAEFELGERLSEEKLAAALGVSRTPVHEALTELQREGLIDIQPQRGSFVFKVVEADLEQLCQFRQATEVQALRLCFLRDREGTVAQMRRAIDAMDAAVVNDDLLGSARADSDLHETLLVNCGNSYFQASYRSVSGKIAALRAHQSQIQAGPAVNNEHRLIVDAFERGDLVQAEGLLTQHVLKMRDRYRAASKALPSPGRRHNAAARLEPLG